ncbi:hypothetical protein AB0892_08040 [Streptomyces sp. NPDC005409]|uniref:hypothetical protein n=1 Tax=Streptomyces sp. NPDC005409 TaxID=3155342 RepID=UPI0034541ED0
MHSPTVEELLSNVGGLTAERAHRIGARIDVCRRLLDTSADMDAVQQYLKDDDVGTVEAVLITTRLLPEDHPSRLRAAREIVECSPARRHEDS